MITVSSRLAGGLVLVVPKMGVMAESGADHSPLSAISAKLWLLPAEKAAHEALSGPAEQARRRPPRARAERACAPPAVVLMRHVLVTAAAQHGTARPYPHGASFRRCRHLEVSITAEAA